VIEMITVMMMIVADLFGDHALLLLLRAVSCSTAS
jgi:hypothetical protein